MSNDEIPNAQPAFVIGYSAIPPYISLMTTISNWGRYPVVDATLRSFDRPEDVTGILAGDAPFIPRGLGRSYGDASLYTTILSGLRHNKITAWDPITGRITCQAGVTLKDLLEIFVPRGWFLPVTPGTKFVTIGGAIAADVHGKNHHVASTFGSHVESMTLGMTDGTVRTCTPDRDPELFEATCGGMGLTGVILDATFCLRPIETAYIREEIVEAPNLPRIMELFEESSDWTYSVAWIDCIATGSRLGRSLMMRGEHALCSELPYARQQAAPLILPDRRKASIPVDFPSFALNRLTVSTFNRLYYWKNAHGTSQHIVDYDSFFYPLDFVHDWNRIYGRKGFLQYQFVLPKANSRQGMTDILKRISASGWGSFLAVLKLFGKQDSLISFPMEGYTLALDFPIRDGLLPFLDELDRMVIDQGGRIYLAKDARMKKEVFRAGYPRADEFIGSVQRFNPQFKLRSLLAERLGITS